MAIRPRTDARSRSRFIEFLRYRAALRAGIEMQRGLELADEFLQLVGTNVADGPEIEAPGVPVSNVESCTVSSFATWLSEAALRDERD